MTKEKLKQIYETIDNEEAVLAKKRRMLREFLPKIETFSGEYWIGFGYFKGCCLDIENVSRETLPRLLEHLSAGKWQKELCGNTAINYINETMFDFPVRIYAVEPPGTCRIEIEEVEVPARKEKRYKMVCKDEPELAPAQ